MKMLVVDGIQPPYRPVVTQTLNLLPSTEAVTVPQRGTDRRVPIVVAALLLFSLLISLARWHPIHLHLSLPSTSQRSTPVAVAKPAPAPAPAPVAAAAPAVHIATSQELSNAISTFLQGQPVPYFVAVKDLKNGQTFANRDGDVIESASLYKLFVANQTYRMIDQGAWNLGTPAGDSKSRTIEQCLGAMITVSDNDCGQALGAKLGWGRQANNLQMQGYTGTDLNASPTKTNARDVALLLENIYRGKFLSAASAAHFMNLLKNQQVNDRLPQGLPAGTAFAHKTGELDGYMHDAGIVFGPKSDYVIVAMSGPWQTNSNSFTPDAQLSQIVYSTLQR